MWQPARMQQQGVVSVVENDLEVKRHPLLPHLPQVMEVLTVLPLQDSGRGACPLWGLGHGWGQDGNGGTC